MQTCSCSMYVCQKETGQKRGANLRAQKARGKVQCPKRGIAPACRSNLLLRSRYYHDQVRMQLFLKMRGTFRCFVIAKTAAIFDKSQLFLSSTTFRTKKIEHFFGARVRVREYFWLSSRVRLCSVKFHRARLSALCTCSRVRAQCPAN